jgi:hypothetical protein
MLDPAKYLECTYVSALLRDRRTPGHGSDPQPVERLRTVTDQSRVVALGRRES